jgi:hypothetical protein
VLHLLDGKVVCKRCGAPLDIPEGHTAAVTFLAESGHPVIRLLKVNAVEIHRCEVNVRRSPRKQGGWSD